MLSVVLAVAEDVIRDNIDLPFVNDPQVIGEWQSVDYTIRHMRPKYYVLKKK